MKMTRYITFFALIAFTAIQAQSAKSLLDDVSKKYKNAISYYIQFDYELNNKKSKVSQKEEGEIYASKAKYKLSLLGIKQIYNGKSLYTIDEEAKEVSVSKPKKNSSDLMTPTKVLDIYKSGYKLVMDSKTSVKGRSVQYVKLIPTTKSDVKYYKIGIYTDKNELYQYQEMNNSNTMTTLTVNKFLENLIISKANFRFNKSKYKNKGYFITEL